MARVLHRVHCLADIASRGYDQFVTLQRRHFDVPPKIVGVDVLGPIPDESFQLKLRLNDCKKSLVRMALGN